MPATVGDGEASGNAGEHIWAVYSPFWMRVKTPSVATHEFAYAGKDIFVLVVRLDSGDWVWSFEYPDVHAQINDVERYPSPNAAIDTGVRGARRYIDARRNPRPQ